MEISQIQILGHRNFCTFLMSVLPSPFPIFSYSYTQLRNFQIYRFWIILVFFIYLQKFPIKYSLGLVCRVGLLWDNEPSLHFLSGNMVETEHQVWSYIQACWGRAGPHSWWHDEECLFVTQFSWPIFLFWATEPTSVCQLRPVEFFIYFPGILLVLSVFPKSALLFYILYPIFIFLIS